LIDNDQESISADWEQPPPRYRIPLVGDWMVCFSRRRDQFPGRPWLADLFRPVSERIAYGGLGFAAAFLVFSTITGPFVLGPGSQWRGIIGLNYLLVYPPLWVSIAGGLATWACLAESFDNAEVWESLKTFPVDASRYVSWKWWAFLVCLQTVVALSAIFPKGLFRTTSELKDEGSHGDVSSSAASHDWPLHEMVAWVKNDEEISEPVSDLFGHDEVAERIYRRLKEEEAPTIAVVGQHGSGKSTIKKLLECRLRNDERIQLVSISLWPYDTPEAAVAGILKAVAAVLGRHVDVLGLTGLPDKYVAMIEQSVPTLSGLARALRPSLTPREIVDRYSQGAIAAGLKLVLWIEDVERFAGSSQLPDAARAEQEFERLGAIRALLHLLDRAPMISVIIADASLGSRFDLDKIARYVEQPPTLNQLTIRRVLSNFRRHCLSGYPCPIIDGATEDERRRFDPTAPEDSVDRWIREVHEEPLPLPEAMSRAVKTPRGLKSTLRLTLDAWRKLAGEIDLDCLLAISALRAEWPEIFAHIADHSELFVHGMTGNFTQNNEDDPHPVRRQLNALLAKVDKPRTAIGLRALVEFLFPRILAEQDRANSTPMKRPQALYVAEPTEYWRRYLSLEAKKSPASDQEVLADIHAWREGTSTRLLDRLLDSAGAWQVVQFRWQFRSDELCKLLWRISWAASDLSAGNWESRAKAPGIGVVAKIMEDLGVSRRKLTRVILAIIRVLGKKHLPLVWDIVDWFTHSGTRFFSDEERLPIRKRLAALLPDYFVGDGAPDRLIRAMREGNPTIPSSITFAAQQPSPQALPFEKWHEFANTLFGVAEREPSLGLPMIVW
jgi:hypothetical protein